MSPSGSRAERIEAAARAALMSFNAGDGCPWCNITFRTWGGSEHRDGCEGADLADALAQPAEKQIRLLDAGDPDLRQDCTHGVSITGGDAEWRRRVADAIRGIGDKPDPVAAAALEAQARSTAAASGDFAEEWVEYLVPEARRFLGRGA